MITQEIKQENTGTGFTIQLPDPDPETLKRWNDAQIKNDE